MRFYLLFLFGLCSISYAGILPDVQREELISRVLQNFWGRAKLPNGEFVQPSSQRERNSIPVSSAIAHRSLDAGEISGLAEWCKLDWHSNYFALTQAARTKGLNDKQVAFVSVLHGAAQGRIFSIMSDASACSAQQRTNVEHMLNQSKTRGLDGT